MEIPPVIFNPNSPNKTQTGFDFSPLRPGQQIFARLINYDPVNLSLALVTNKGKNFTLQSNLATNFNPGQILKLQVEQTQPELLFKLISRQLPSQPAPTKSARSQPNLNIPSNLLLKPYTPLPLELKAATAEKPSVLTQVLSGQIIKQSSSNLLLKLPAKSIDHRLLHQLGPWLETQSEKKPQTGSRSEFITLKIASDNLSNIKPETKQSVKVSNPEAFNQLKTGETVQLQIKSTQQAVILNIKPELAKSGLEQSISHFQRIEKPLSLTLKQIVQTLPNIEPDTKIDTNIVRKIQQIAAHIPDLNDLKQVSKLKSLLHHSGIFLEAELTQSKSTEFRPGIDLKALLINFNQLLNNKLQTEGNNQQTEAETTDSMQIFKELQQKTESGLAKLVLNQLLSLTGEETHRPLWVLDLPFTHKGQFDNLHLELQLDKKPEHEESESLQWLVNISITPPGLGQIDCKLICVEQTISARFQSEDKHVVQTIENNMAYFEQQMAKAGLKTGSLHVSLGKTQIAPPPYPASKGFFDQKV